MAHRDPWPERFPPCPHRSQGGLRAPLSLPIASGPDPLGLCQLVPFHLETSSMKPMTP